MVAGKMPEARDKPIWRVMYDAHTHGGDPVEILRYRAEKAESLLRQIACNTDPVWARNLACDFWGIEAPPTNGTSRPPTKGQDTIPLPTAPGGTDEG